MSAYFYDILMVLWPGLVATGICYFFGAIDKNNGRFQIFSVLVFGMISYLSLIFIYFLARFEFSHPIVLRRDPWQNNALVPNEAFYYLDEFFISFLLSMLFSTAWILIKRQQEGTKLK